MGGRAPSITIIITKKSFTAEVKMVTATVAEHRQLDFILRCVFPRLTQHTLHAPCRLYNATEQP